MTLHLAKNAIFILSLLVTGASQAQESPPACSPRPVLEGCGTVTWPDGSSLTGNFANGQFDGTVRISYADGAIFEGNYSDSIGSGQATFINSSGEHSSGAFHDGEIDTDRTPKDALGEFPFWRRLVKSEAHIRCFAIVDENGDVTNLVVDVPNSFSDTDVSALNAALAVTVLKWKFHPATIDDQLVRSPAEFNITYRNQDKGSH